MRRWQKERRAAQPADHEEEPVPPVVHERAEDRGPDRAAQEEEEREQGHRRAARLRRQLGRAGLERRVERDVAESEHHDRDREQQEGPAGAHQQIGAALQPAAERGQVALGQAGPDSHQRDSADERRDAVAREQQTHLELVEPEPRHGDHAEVREAAPQEHPLEADDPVEDPRRAPAEDEAVVEPAAGGARGRVASVRVEEEDRRNERQASHADVQDPPGHEVGHRSPDRRREALGERGHGGEPPERSLALRVGHGRADVGEREGDHRRREDSRDEPHRVEHGDVVGLARQERPHAEADRRAPDDPDRPQPVAQRAVEELAETVRQHVEHHRQTHRGHARPERVRDRRQEGRHHADVDLDEERESREEGKRGEPSRRPRGAGIHPVATRRGGTPPGNAAVAPSTGRVSTPLIRQLPCSSTSS